MTQNERVLKYMTDFGSITPMDALNDLGIYRLSARIYDLARSGIAINSIMETGKNRYGETVRFSRYSLG